MTFLIRVHDCEVLLTSNTRLALRQSILEAFKGQFVV
jgi:hypothetical protein